MKQENQETTLTDCAYCAYCKTDYHNKHKVPVRKYHALQVYDAITGRKRWCVAWFTSNGGVHYRFPTSYGMRAAVRLSNRLQEEWEKKQRIVAMARNSYTIGI